MPVDLDLAPEKLLHHPYTLWHSQPSDLDTTPFMTWQISRIAALWASGLTLSLAYVAISAHPSSLLIPLHTFLAPSANNSTTVFFELGALVLGGLVYVGVLHSLFSRQAASAAKAGLASIVLVLLQSAWAPTAFMTEERFLVLFPVCLNIFLTITTLLEQPTVLAVPEQWQGDQK